MWLRFGPLGLDVHVQRPGSDALAEERAGVTGVGFAGDTEPRAYFDGRFVRLLGRVYKVPADERVLVLLVEEEGERSAKGGAIDVARASIRTVVIPPVRRPEQPATTPSRGDSASYRTAVRVVTVLGGSLPEWDAALHDHPEVRVFMTGVSDA